MYIYTNESFLLYPATQEDSKILHNEKLTLKVCELLVIDLLHGLYQLRERQYASLTFSVAYL